VTVKELIKLLEEHPDKNAEVVAIVKDGSLAFQTEGLARGLEYGYVAVILV
jgi:hypothetical protein